MAVSKRVRFEVLRRDGHRCRYCGAAAENGALLTVDRDAYCQAFIDQWAINDEKLCLLPDHWRAVVVGWHDFGLPITVIAEAVDIAMAARISGYKVFRYCVGIVNRRKDEVLKRAMEEFAQNVGGR